MTFSVPAINADNEAFWTSGRQGRLEIMRCQDCETWFHPPSPRCSACFSANVAPTPASGRGTVYSFTINRRAWEPDLEVPYVIAVVALEEPGVRLLTNIVGCDPEAVTIGMPVEVEFELRGPVAVPVFRAVAA